MEHSQKFPYCGMPSYTSYVNNEFEPAPPRNGNLGPNDSAATGQAAFSAVSNHILETQIITKSIEKFDGTAYKFWTWVSKVQEYSRCLNLSPMQTLQLWESYTDGGPVRMISRARSSMGEVTQNDVKQLFGRLVIRYASPQQIASELRRFVEEREPSKGKTLATSFWTS